MRLLVNEIFATIDEATLEERNILRETLTFEKSKAWGEEEASAECLVKANRFHAGLTDLVVKRLASREIVVEIVYSDTRLQVKPDLRHLLQTLSPLLLPGIELRPYQYDAVVKMVHHMRGIIMIPTAGGKTEVAQAAFRYLLNHGEIQRGLYLVEAKGLFGQAVRRFKERGFRVGSYTADGLDDESAEVVIAMVPSLYSHLKNGKETGLSSYQALIADEAHHVPANRWTKVLEHCPARYRWGMSATPTKYITGPSVSRDYKLIGLLGEMIYDVPTAFLIERGYIAQPVVTFIDITKPYTYFTPDWLRAYKRGIVENDYFHEVVASISIQMAKLGHRVLILVFEKEHGERVLTQLRTKHQHEACMFSGDETLHEWVNGSLTSKMMSIDDVITVFNSNDSFILVGTPAIGEGVNLPSASVVIPAFGGKDYKNSLQAVGRGMRPKSGDNRMFVFDFVHYSHPFLTKHSRDRRETYESKSYLVQDGYEALQSQGICLQPPPEEN